MARTKRPTRPGPGEPQRVVAYLRVSTQEQADSRLGLAAQEAAIRREVEHRGWDLVALYSDTCSGGKPLADRAGGEQALDDLRAGRADVLIASKLDRLSRGVADFASVLERSDREGWALLLLDIGIGPLDTTNLMGKAQAQMASVFAELERARIGQRTREALAEKREAGWTPGPPDHMRIAPALAARIRSMHEAGESYSAIARTLNGEGVPTARGGAHWYPSTVRGLLVEK